jgi:hypothetical protein
MSRQRWARYQALACSLRPHASLTSVHRRSHCASAARRRTGDAREVRSGSGCSLHHSGHLTLGGTSGRHDGPLIGRTEYLTEAGQRGLDEPRFEAHPCGLAVGIKFLGHSQRAECRCDAPGYHNCADDDAGKAPVCAGSFRDLLNHGQSCASCGAIAFKGRSRAPRYCGRGVPAATHQTRPTRPS